MTPCKDLPENPCREIGAGFARLSSLAILWHSKRHSLGCSLPSAPLARVVPSGMALMLVE
jgi:hypothetical protein